MLRLLKRPSGFLPLVISGAFIAGLLTALAQDRLVRTPDEGTGAHLFQILMPVQFAIMLFFAATWLPQRPRAALQILCLQAAAALAVLAIVYFEHL